MTDYYQDLPEELQRFFPIATISIPEETRHYINDAWTAITPKQQDEIVMKCRKERDSLRRILTVVKEATIALLDSPPSASRRLSI